MAVLTESAPVSYVEKDGIREKLGSSFIVKGDKIGFRIDGYKGKGNLVIDPELFWSTLLGGSADEIITSVTHDPQGNIYVTGHSSSTNFPVSTGAHQTSLAGSFDAFVSKFDAYGVRLWTTYLGGASEDKSFDIIYCSSPSSPSVFITGYTHSTAFPVYDPGGTYVQTAKSSDKDGFISRFSPSGVLTWSTYYGGNGPDELTALAMDNSYNLYSIGRTSTSSIPNTFPTYDPPGFGDFYQGVQGGTFDVVIVKLNPALGRAWATFYGGAEGEGGTGATCDNAGNLYVSYYIANNGLTLMANQPHLYNPTAYFQDAPAGALGTYDCALAMFAPTGQRIWATRYGGNSNDLRERVVTDKWDNLYLVFFTSSTDLSLVTPPGAYGQAFGGGSSDAFIVMFDKMGNRKWCTYYGGAGDEFRNFGLIYALNRNLAVDMDGSFYFTSNTTSPDFPLAGSSCENYMQNVKGAGSDAFIVQFASNHALEWSTYVGGAGDEQGFGVTVDRDYGVILCGQSSSATGTFPVRNPGGGSYYQTSSGGGVADAFVMKFAFVHSHTTQVIANGEVRSWGDADYGQLGTGSSMAYSSVPVNVSSLPSTVIATAQGKEHTLALLSSGTVMAWGKNTCGQLGNGTYTSSNVPVNVSASWGTNKVIAIASGDYHSLVLLDDGTVRAWGRNEYGQLGNSTTISSNVPVLIAGLGNVKAIAASGFHSMALLSNGQVFSWGRNNFGQLGDGTTINRNTPVAVITSSGALTGVMKVAAGAYHSLVLLANGTVMAWGRNDMGQLGDNSFTDRYNPVQVMNGGAALGNITEISAGGYHSLALVSDGTLRSWGYNFYGQLGNGSSLNSNVPVAVSGGLSNNIVGIYSGMWHSWVLRSNGDVLAWGRSHRGQIGNGTTGDQHVPVLVMNGDICNEARFIAAGHNFSLASVYGGEAVSWGMNSSGQLSTGTLFNMPQPYTIPVTGNVAVKTAGGQEHTLVLTADGTVWAAGGNSGGQLGNGSLTGSQVLMAVLSNARAVACGSNHSLALMADGTVKAWGTNSSGQLGDGSLVNRTSPVTIPGLSNVVVIAAGNEHSLALLADGTVRSWGSNASGELGNGTFLSSSVPVSISGLVSCKSVTAGKEFSMALMGNGTLRSWGKNNSGQLGNGTTLNSNVPVIVSAGKVKQVSAGTEHVLAVHSNGSVSAWGLNRKGQLGNNSLVSTPTPAVIPGLNGVVQAASGGDHSLALLGSGTVSAWGYNASGQLADGTTDSSLIPKAVPWFSCMPVQLELLTLKAKKSGENVYLIWKTVSPDVYAFELEKRTGSSWEKVSFIPRGPSPEYAYTDIFLFKTSYYRVKQINSSREEHYSNIAVISNASGIELFPNPVSEWLYVTSSGKEPLTLYSRVEIADTYGRQVLVSPASGQEGVKVNVGGLPSGVYLLRILGESGEVIHSGKFIRE
jgi:alpha-tubulin suppressor-like RCC1 family protein